MATHRALLVVLPGRADGKLNTVVNGKKPSCSQVFGPMDRLDRLGEDVLMGLAGRIGHLVGDVEVADLRNSTLVKELAAESTNCMEAWYTSARK